MTSPQRNYQTHFRPNGRRVMTIYDPRRAHRDAQRSQGEPKRTPRVPPVITRTPQRVAKSRRRDPTGTPSEPIETTSRRRRPNRTPMCTQRHTKSHPGNNNSSRKFPAKRPQSADDFGPKAAPTLIPRGAEETPQGPQRCPDGTPG